MTTAGIIHVLGVWAAAVFGLFIVLRRKGDWVHRWTGRAYVASMVVVNAAGLLVFEDRPSFGPFHALAVISLATLCFGVYCIKFGQSSRRMIIAHGHFMGWSLVGLGAAGAGQGAAAVGGPVVLTILVVLGLGGLIVHMSPIGRTARRLAELAERP